MKQTPTNLLALFARRKEIGFALMNDGQLYRYGVRRIRAKGIQSDFAHAVGKSLSPLLESLGAEGTVVIEQISVSSRRKRPRTDIPDLVKHFVSGLYDVVEVSLCEVKQGVCGERHATHRTLVDRIVQRYPVFAAQIKDAKLYKRRYWEKAIIAVGLAETARGRKP